MSLPGFEFVRVDWTNAVYIPLILAVPVAAAVAIYTGIVVMLDYMRCLRAQEKHPF